MTAGIAAFHGGAGAMDATAVGVVAGIVTLTTGQLAFAVVRSPFIRAAIALLFAAPAAVAGYHATLALVHVGVSSPGWGAVFAAIGGTLVGATAWARMTLLPDPLKTGRPFPTGAAEPLLASAGKEG